ncbi:MAG: hypothetical protein ACOYJF_07250 [Prevotella sp.]|jgi:hypothetical protein
MKRLLFVSILFSLLSLFSCGGSNKKDASQTDSLSDTLWEEGPVKADSTIIDSVVR